MLCMLEYKLKGITLKNPWLAECCSTYFKTTLCPSGLQSSLNGVGSLCVVSSREMGLLLSATAESILESQSRAGYGVLLALFLPWGCRFWPALSLSLPSRSDTVSGIVSALLSLIKRDVEALELLLRWCPQPCSLWVCSAEHRHNTELLNSTLKDLCFSMGTSRCCKLFLFLSAPLLPSPG